jgi:hypothetical protein
MRRLLINLLKKFQDLLLAYGGGIGCHIHCVSGGIKSNFLQIFFWNAVSLQANGYIELPIELKQALLQIIGAIEQLCHIGKLLFASFFIGLTKQRSP